jgi:hypothetical protein
LLHWNPEETCQAEALAAQIEGCRLPRRRIPLASPLELRLSAGLKLVEGLAGTTRALIVRQLLRALGFDEYRHIQWRLEHKLIQALVLTRWVPELVPITWGLDAVKARHGATGLRDYLSHQFPNGYVLKSALGDSSGESWNPDNEEPLLSAPGFPAASARALLEERHIVQERIPIATEYRVHSLEEDVIEDLTFRRYEGGSIPLEREAPNGFVTSVLRRLPDAIVGGSLLAWDVVLQPSGEFTIIEVNFSGFHPEFKRGFHCSGYFHDPRWGDCDTARLLNHVARRDAVAITPVADVDGHPGERRFYRETARWQRRHLGLPVEPSAARARQASEPEELEARIRQIATFTLPRRRPPLDGVLELRLSQAIPLMPQLAASSRALLLRQVLLALGFDERRLTAWRLEHKLVQAQVFRHYRSDSLPRTRGLDELGQDVDAGGLRSRLHETFPDGFVIKTALGDCSGKDCDQRTEAVLAWIEGGGRAMQDVDSAVDEEFIVQERKAIRCEYRVHTIEDRVVEEITSHRHEGPVSAGEREAPNRYVQEILDALPPGITAGSHLGWDVALLDDGACGAIEVNVGGIHPEYNPGFHASGFFHHKDYGAVYTARLLHFLEKIYRCRIDVQPDAPEYHHEFYFYSEVKDWKSRF